MTEIQYPDISLWAVLPQLIVLATAVGALLGDLAVKRVQRINITLTSILGLLIALFATRSLEASSDPIFAGMLVRDGLSLLLDQIFIIGAILVTLISHDYARRAPKQYAEFMALILFSTLGMMVIASSADLIAMFVGIELLSLSLFVLAGTDKHRLASGEASLKYFLLGAFSTGFLVYGMAFIFGITRTTNLIVIGHSLVETGGEATPLLVLGFALLLVGLGFKISLAPFHMWAPDVYQGAPTPVSAWIATGSKIAGFVALLRIFIWPGMSFAPLAEYWVDGIYWLALITMIIGNAGALVQTDIKRMLAYSSIAHGGYLSMAFTSHNQIGAEALLFYLAAYLFMTVGAFGVVIIASRCGKDCETISDLSGLSKQRPYLAGLMVVFMLSLAGMPGTAGFVGKLWLFGAAIQAQYYTLAMVGVLTTLLSFYYYLRVIITMYVHEANDEDYFNRYSISNGLALTLCAAGLLILGVFPNLLWGAIRLCTGAA
ncbi:MAG: NADH-quinone oxidoreductase subunit N [Candidatus Hinthialibacter antarcticus]|nr:NADH-quinone oxidoreductase subunit N [Candidatus Hinthialibacter antarcticus]